MDRNQERIELFKAYTVEEIKERRELFGTSVSYDLFSSWSGSSGPST